MDDLFEGYMALGPIGDFLEESPPFRSTRKSPKVSRAEEHVSSEEQTQPQSVTASSGDPTTLSALRQRRGHTKSRLGCLTCKKRKIKCQETWPSCANCDKRGYICTYPDVFKYAHQDHVSLVMPSPYQVVKLVDTPTVYSADDMQLFHHYLISAYPCIPHDFEEIWTRDVPKISHQYPYLMDAMLALAGSHLAVQVDNPKTSLALQHRQKAIVGLEDAFSRWPTTAEESHVMLAASYLLSFQSSYMEDGFLEHFLSLRGCSVLSQFIVSSGNGGFLAGHLLAFTNPLLPMNQDSTFQHIDWSAITTPPPGAPNPIPSFIAFTAILTIFSTWPHNALVHVFDPTNQLGNIVLAHFCAIRFVLSPLSVPKNALRTPTKAVVEWFVKIIAAVDEDEGDGEWSR
ncbi:Zn-clus multi-domain protein, partial [Pyrenophora tritici-repentis]